MNDKNQTSEETKFRKCFVLREVQIEMEDLKKGDVFCLEPASGRDNVNVDRTQLWIANGDGHLEPDIKGNAGVTCSRVRIMTDPKQDPVFNGEAEG